MIHAIGADRSSLIDLLGQLRVATQRRLSSLPEGDVRPSIEVTYLPGPHPGLTSASFNSPIVPRG